MLHNRTNEVIYTYMNFIFFVAGEKEKTRNSLLIAFTSSSIKCQNTVKMKIHN